MLLIAAVSILALSVAYSLSKRSPHDRWQETVPRGRILTVGVQIICGDCSGDGDRPIKTYLDLRGSCTQCGGRSYMLASSRIFYAQRVMIARQSEQESARGQTRVHLMKPPTGLRAVQVRSLSA